MNYPAAELRGSKMNLQLIHLDAGHLGILLIKYGAFVDKLAQEVRNLEGSVEQKQREILSG